MQVPSHARLKYHYPMLTSSLISELEASNLYIRRVPALITDSPPLGKITDLNAARVRQTRRGNADSAVTADVLTDHTGIVSVRTRH